MPKILIMPSSLSRLPRENIHPSLSVCGPATPALHHLLFATPELQKFCLKNNEIRGNSKHRAGTLSLSSTVQAAHYMSLGYLVKIIKTWQVYSYDKLMSCQITNWQQTVGGVFLPAPATARAVLVWVTTRLCQLNQILIFQLMDPVNECISDKKLYAMITFKWIISQSRHDDIKTG